MHEFVDCLKECTQENKIANWVIVCLFVIGICFFICIGFMIYYVRRYKMIKNGLSKKQGASQATS